MNMRQQMVTTLEELMATDERLVVLLADISYSLFNKDNPIFSERLLNLGILEQTLISSAAGMALEGFIPAVHSFVPFLVERPLEQLKDDFCYQQLGGNFISTGASYDYSVEGMTHHGPGDVQILRSLPGMQIVVPGTPSEFDTLFRESYANGSPTYYRLSVKSNPVEYSVRFGELTVVKQGKRATVIAVGPMLASVLPAVEDMDVTVLYCTTVAPFDAETLRSTSKSNTIITVEPYYEGALVPDICSALEHTPIRIETIGVPHKVLRHYGKPEEHDEELGLIPQGIRHRIERFLND
jgi:transketolase